MEKLSREDREALEKAKKYLLQLIEEYLDSCLVLEDVKRFHRFTSNLKDFMHKESERFTLKHLDIDVRESQVEIREAGKVYYVEVMHDKDGKIWGVYPDKTFSDYCVYPNGMRNLLILFEKRVLKLEDFPRETHSGA